MMNNKTRKTNHKQTKQQRAERLEILLNQMHVTMKLICEELLDHPIALIDEDVPNIFK